MKFLILLFFISSTALAIRCDLLLSSQDLDSRLTSLAQYYVNLQRGNSNSSRISFLEDEMAMMILQDPAHYEIFKMKVVQLLKQTSVKDQEQRQNEKTKEQIVNSLKEFAPKTYFKTDTLSLRGGGGISSDGSRIAYVQNENTLVVLDLSGSNKTVFKKRFGKNQILTAEISNDGLWTAVTVNGDSSVYVTQLTPPQKTFKIKHKSAAIEAQFSQDGAHLFSKGADGEVRRTHLRSELTVWTVQQEKRRSGLFESRDGRFLLVDPKGSNFAVLDANNGDLKFAYKKLENITASLSASGQIMAYAEFNKKMIWVFNSADFSNPQKKIRMKNEIRGLSLSDDGRVIVVWFHNSRNILLLDSLTGQEIKKLEAEGDVLEATISPDQKYIVTQTVDNKIDYFETQSGQSIRFYDSLLVLKIGFSKDSSRILLLPRNDELSVIDIVPQVGRP